MFVNRPPPRGAFSTPSRTGGSGTGGGGMRSKGTILLVVLLIIAGIFGERKRKKLNKYKFYVDTNVRGTFGRVLSLGSPFVSRTVPTTTTTCPTLEKSCQVAATEFLLQVGQ